MLQLVNRCLQDKVLLCEIVGVVGSHYFSLNLADGVVQYFSQLILVILDHSDHIALGYFTARFFLGALGDI